MRIDVEVDIEISHVIEYIEYANNGDIKRIKRTLKEGGHLNDVGPVLLDTMDKERKMEFLASIFEKFTLEQLEERLK